MKLMQDEDFGMNLLLGKICCALLRCRGAFLKVWSAWNGWRAFLNGRIGPIDNQSKSYQLITHDVCPL